MSKSPFPIVFSLALCALAACAACAAGAEAPSPDVPSMVESISAKQSNVLRLTVHAIPAGGTEYVAVASTSKAKLGQPSDPEDLESMRTGEVVVLDEPDAIDVTVPILMVGGKHTAAAGVTVKSAVGREAAIELSRAIAAEIERGMAASGAQ